MPNRGASATAVTWMGHGQAHTPDLLWLPDSSPAQPPPRSPASAFLSPQSQGAARLLCTPTRWVPGVFSFLITSGRWVCSVRTILEPGAPSEGRKNHPSGNKMHSESLCRLLNRTTGLLLLLCLPPSPVRAPAPQEVRPPCISGHRGRERLSVSEMGGDPHTHTHKLGNQTTKQLVSTSF